MSNLNLAGPWTLWTPEWRDGSGPLQIPAEIPGDNFTALLQQNQIPDPYEGLNELQVQDLGQIPWELSREFEVSQAFLDRPRHFLFLESVDTVAEIFLNGEHLGSSDNMFLPFDREVTGKLQRGINRLKICFRSAEQEALNRAEKLSYPLPHAQFPVQSPHRNLVRKAQFQAGWDWGPCLMTCGVYGRCEVTAEPQTVLKRFWCEVIPPPSGQTWTVRIHAEVDAADSRNLTLQVGLKGFPAVTVQTPVREGLHPVTAAFTVENPELWFPAGYGNQPLYQVQVQVGSQRQTRTIGFRRLEWKVKDDDLGRSMTLTVNGTDIFCKGANWIPADALPSRWTGPQVERLLTDAVDAHMNMVRVWGGGVYESEEFYSLCDRLGLLVWQDFMFACSTYPDSPEFLASVEAEVTHQVKRLKDHPCLALFCGNNEDLGALGWFDEVKKAPSRYLVGYDRLNEGTIGRVVRQLDGEGRWWPTSPCGGVDDYHDGWHSDGRGDMHYWSVWHEGKSFDAYRSVKPRFCSEFGFQSFPWPSDVHTFAPEDQRNITSPVMEHHQRNPRGNSRILETFSRYFRIPQGFENTLYLSQVQQALAIKTAVEYWHSLRPVCMGTLYWQLNDLWPVASWSSITYSGKWKLLHYEARRFYAPVQVIGIPENDGGLQVILINDGLTAVSGRLRAEFRDFEGKAVLTEESACQIKAQTAQPLYRWTKDQMPTVPTFLRLNFDHPEGRAVNTVWFSEPKRSPLKNPAITWEVLDEDQGVFIQVQAAYPAFWVALDPGDLEGRFEDNGFDLVPGEVRKIRWRGKASARSLKKALKIFDLYSSGI